MSDEPALPDGTYLTVDQLADRWHTTPNAIYLRRHKRTAPPGYMEGKRILFPLADVEAHERQKQAADSRFNTALDPTKKPIQARVSRSRKADADAA
jgi:hypothetical protein